MTVARGLSVKRLLEWRDRSFSSLETQQAIDSWIARECSDVTVATLDQDRRLQVEEWMRAHNVLFRAPHLMCTLALHTPIGLDGIRAALGKALKRHRILRSFFVVDGATGEARERAVAETLRGTVSQVGLYRPVSAAECQASVQEIHVQASVSCLEGPAVQAAWKDLTAPFDATLPPLLRAGLVVGTDGTRALFLAVDRLIADWWSVGLLCADLAESLGSGACHDLPTLPARFLSERQARQLGRAAVTHWRKQWREPAAMPIEMDDIPLSLPRSDLGSAAFGWRSTPVTADQARGLTALARRLSLDLCDVMLGAVVTVLQHITQKTTVSVWTECRSDFRSTAEVGPFSNAHVLTIDVADERDPAQITRSVAAARRHMGPHHNIPLELVWRTMKAIPPQSSPQASFQHIDFGGAFSNSCVRPGQLLESNPMRGLQFYSWSVGKQILVGLGFMRSRCSDMLADNVVADLADVLTATSAMEIDLSHANRGQEAAGPALVPLQVTADPSRCHLCSQRSLRSQVASRPGNAGRPFSVAQRDRHTRPGIFILSNFRSGSTLLRFALDAHPDICCPAEVRLGMMCQTLFNVAELTGDAAILDDKANDAAVSVMRVRELADVLMGEYCRQKGKTYWCEKSPANAEALFVISTIFPDASFICLHRHVSDQVHSTLDYEGPIRLQRHLGNRGNDLIAAATDRWCGITEKLLALEHANSERTVRVRYEAFVTDPEGELRRILKAIGARPVDGLSTAAFGAPHDRGPSDAKILGTANVRKDRVGKPGGVDVQRLPTDLARRTRALLRRVGYTQDDRV